MSRWNAPVAVLLMAVFVLIGPVGADANQAQPAAKNSSFTAALVLPDDGKAPFIAEIDAAASSIQLYIYLLSDEETIKALVRAHHRGVAVQVMLEPVPFGGARTELETFLRLEAAGLDVRWSSPHFRFAHVKMMIIDRELVLIMNLNMTGAAFSQNREFAVVTGEPAAVAQAIGIFEADWNGVDETPAGPLVISPETSRTDLLRLIGSAQTSIDVYAEFITDIEIVEALVDAEMRGVRVRMVMSESFDESLWHEEPGFLARNGVDVRIVSLLYIHAKVLLVDGELAFIGSQNFTANSLDNNREVGVIVTDPASLSRISRAFEDDFNGGIPLSTPE